MKIKVLLENTKSQRHFKNAHGLSLLLSFNQQKFLFDTGPNQNFIQNAQPLAEPLTDLSGIIISHGHSDHIGGLPYLLKNSAPLFLSKDALKPRFIKVLGKQIYVGPEKKTLSKLDVWGNKISEVTEIAENFFLVPLHKTNKSTKNLYMDQPPVLDDFSDELMAVYLQPDGMIVFTGCSHHGILEMARQALATFPDKKINYLIGGFHLIGIPYFNNLAQAPSEILQLGEQLATMPIDHILTGHCTGKKAFTLLHEVLGEKIQSFSTGEAFSL